MSPLAPGFLGHILVGATKILAYQGSGVDLPISPMFPPATFGHLFQLNYAPGLRQAAVNIRACPKADWWTAATLLAWLARDNTYADAAVNSGGITVRDGSTGVNVSGAKHAGGSLAISQGQLPVCNLAFRGTGYTDSNATSSPPDAGNLLSFGDFSIQNGLDPVVSWALNYDAGIFPNPELNGTVWPTAMHAGGFTAMLRLVMQAGRTPPSDGAAFTARFGLIDFTINNPLIASHMRRINLPLGLREYPIICRATAAVTATTDPGTAASPVTIAAV